MFYSHNEYPYLKKTLGYFQFFFTIGGALDYLPIFLGFFTNALGWGSGVLIRAAQGAALSKTVTVSNVFGILHLKIVAGALQLQLIG